MAITFSDPRLGNAMRRAGDSYTYIRNTYQIPNLGTDVLYDNEAPIGEFAVAEDGSLVFSGQAEIALASATASTLIAQIPNEINGFTIGEIKEDNFLVNVWDPANDTSKAAIVAVTKASSTAPLELTVRLSGGLTTAERVTLNTIRVLPKPLG